jgi:SAM-dependent methyltransferase
MNIKINIVLMEFEQKNVIDVYNVIAKEFDQTRAYLWNRVKKFLIDMKPYSLAIDIGCGNGKNMNSKLRPDIYFQGSDITPEFCQICSRKGLNVSMANIIRLPYRSDMADYVMCVAVIHHLSTPELRLKAVQELVRITRPGGRIFILVWAQEQFENKKRHFTEQDNLVSWQSKKGETYYRYYHVFKKEELESLISSLDGIRIEESFYDFGNWGVIMTKEK